MGATLSIFDQGPPRFHNHQPPFLVILLHFTGPLPLSHDGFHHGKKLRRITVESFVQRMIEHLTGLPAIKTLRAAVPIKDAMLFRPAHDDGVARLVQEGGLLANFIFVHFTLGDVAHDALQTSVRKNG